MKKIFISTLITLSVITLNAQTKSKIIPVKKPVSAVKPVVKATIFKSNLDSASYALGISVATSFKSGGLNTINYELFNKGIKDVFAGANPLLSKELTQACINTLFIGLNKKREETDKQKYAGSIAEGNAFLAKNKTKAGVKTTASGLQYEVITEGSGAKPLTTNSVTVNYKGTLLNGFEFDSSYKRGSPAKFTLTQVISGWTEGLQLMTEGSKYRFFIPSDLAYGGSATPDGKVPPFSTLIFEVELIKIEQ